MTPHHMLGLNPNDRPDLPFVPRRAPTKDEADILAALAHVAGQVAVALHSARGCSSRLPEGDLAESVDNLIDEAAEHLEMARDMLARATQEVEAEPEIEAQAEEDMLAEAYDDPRAAYDVDARIDAMRDAGIVS